MDVNSEVIVKTCCRCKEYDAVHTLLTMGQRSPSHEGSPTPQVEVRPESPLALRSTVLPPSPPASPREVRETVDKESKLAQVSGLISFFALFFSDELLKCI
jgi:hypothetical protein